MPDQTRQSFLQRISKLTRPATSLRARMRQGFARGTEPVEVKQASPAAPVKVTRETHAPDGQCLYAIGDIHGRRDLLEKLIDLIEEDTHSLPDDVRPMIVFLGDYIDRGLQSRDVIEFLIGERMSKFERVFLMGNHEEALLRFLEDVSFGKQWVRYGGAETLYSYGLQPPNTRGSLDSHDAMAAAEQAWGKVWDAFRTRIPDTHVNFYRNLQHYFIAGDYLFVHAGLRPDVPMENQSIRDMLWIRDEFLDGTNHFPYLIVHGHTPDDAIFRDNRRIGLDTGAFISGKLSAAKLIGSDVSFITT